MKTSWLRPYWAVLIFLAGCDPNPNGPSAPAPSPPSADENKGPETGSPKRVPLKQVGAPIGLIVPRFATK